MKRDVILSGANDNHLSGVILSKPACGRSRRIRHGYSIRQMRQYRETAKRDEPAQACLILRRRARRALAQDDGILLVVFLVNALPASIPALS
jgi:hypothetical protein